MLASSDRQEVDLGKPRDAAEADDVDEANYITADVPDMPQRQQQQQGQQQQGQQQQLLRLNKEEAWFCLPKFRPVVTQLGPS